MTTGNETSVPVSNSMAAFSRQLDQLADSMSLLYIKNNAGGRRIFRDKWSEVAEYVFGSELTAYDIDGVKSDEDRAHRSQMEDEADMRRVELKQTMSGLVEKSVDSGSLQFEYVGATIDKYGALLSQFLYAEDIIERVRPGALDEAKKVREAEKERKENEQAAVPEQAASQEPQVFEGPSVDAPQEPAQTEGEAVEQPLESHQGNPLEQSSGGEQNQDITEAQEVPEWDSVQEHVQQTELSNALEESAAQQPESEGVFEKPEVQQSDSFAELFEVNHIQPQAGEETTEEDRLSVEEIELLSNKEPEIDAPIAVVEEFAPESELDTEGPFETLAEPESQQEEQEPQSEPFLDDKIVNTQTVQEAPLAQEDPLEQVRPIETPMPESAVPEGEVLQEVSLEESLVESAHSEESIISDEAQLEPQSEEQEYQSESDLQPEPFFDDEVVKAQTVQEDAQSPEVVVETEEASVEQQQIHVAEAVREMLGDETQSLVAPDLLDLHEAMAAQKVSEEAELLAQGILQEGGLSESAQFEEKPETAVEPDPQSEELAPEPEPFFDDEIAKVQTVQEEVQSSEAVVETEKVIVESEVQTKSVQVESVLSLEENALRENLSEVLQSTSEPLPESRPVESTEPLLQEEAPQSVDEQVATVQPAAGSEGAVEFEPRQETESQSEEVAPESEPFFDDEIAKVQTVQDEPPQSDALGVLAGRSATKPDFASETEAEEIPHEQESE